MSGSFCDFKRHDVSFDITRIGTRGSKPSANATAYSHQKTL
jgi:hypothetical protein